MENKEYLLANRAVEAERRLDALSALFDPTTFRHVESLGIAVGWRCWDVGAGGPSVVRWLAEKAGPEGHVLATDIDVSWARGAAGPNVEVLRHDIGRDAPPTEACHLVHARLVLVHVADRAAALRSMVGALRPGGWILIEDADPDLQPLACLDAGGPESELANKMRVAFRTLLAQRGVDLAYARKLPRLLREAGLIDVAADAWFPIVHPSCAALEMTTVNMVREALIAQGLATEADIERHLENVRSGRLDLVTSPLIAAWGRRP